MYLSFIPYSSEKGRKYNGKELGKGICQRESGKYQARYVDRYKKRHTISHTDLKVLKRMLEKARYEAEYSMLAGAPKITLEEWFEQFLQLYKVGKVKMLKNINFGAVR